MPKLIFTLPLLTALALGTTALAQETTTQAEEPAASSENAEATQDAGSEADTGLDMGQPVQEDPTYIKETYGDWELKCFRTEAGEDPCQMFQLLREETGNPIAEFSIFRLPPEAQAAAGATIVVPLGTLLTEELKISVDGGKAKSYSYRFCSLVGCYAQIGLTEADVAAFRAGAAATLQIVPAQAPDQQVNIKASLSGFTAAFENTSVLAQ
jgi:invasion protein IalB